MASPKIIGIETEYGIAHTGVVEPNPILASSILVNAYVRNVEGGSAAPAVGWDFEDESPSRDARGAAPDGARPPVVETHLVNAVLTNGARFYVDHAHPEISTPECADPLSVVRFDRAAEEIMRRSMAAARSHLDPGQELIVHKNNSDGKGNSYGCHENYLVARSVPFGRIVSTVIPHFVTRQIYCGAGKVGREVGADTRGPGFQISQRADFFEEEVGLETTLKRPIVNTRDEPHADPALYRRLHVIVGDANLSETATLLKTGTTAVLLAMLEDDCLGPTRTLLHPVPALRAVSDDLTLGEPLELDDGSTMTALEIQWELFESAKGYLASAGPDSLGGESVAALLMGEWEDLLGCLEADLDRAADRIDWVAKHRLLSAYKERDGLDWDHVRLAAIDLQYHDLRPGKCLADRCGLKRLVSPEEVESAIAGPPEDTRAYFRGKCLQRWSPWIVAANWDSLVFDLGDNPLRRVPTMDPAKGTKAHVGELLERCRSPRDLVTALGE